MERIIREKFGIAPQLANRDVKFIFNDDEIKHTDFPGYQVGKQDVRFGIMDLKSNKLLFSMDFYKPYHQEVFGDYGKVILELIYVHEPSLRGLGIGTYYINKLKEYMRTNGDSVIRVVAGTDIDIFKNDPSIKSSKEDLIEYYKRFEDDDIKVDIINA